MYMRRRTRTDEVERKGKLAVKWGRIENKCEELRMRNPRFEKEVKMRRRGVDEEDMIVDSKKGQGGHLPVV